LPIINAIIAAKKAPTNYEKIIGRSKPPKKPLVAASMDSIAEIDGPATNFMIGITEITKKNNK